MTGRCFRDCLLAARRIRRDPLFSAVVVGTLALGMGTVAAVFAVADTALNKAVPFRDATEVVYVHGASLPPSGDRIAWFRQATALKNLAEYRSGTLILTTRDASQQVVVAETSSGLFELAGVKPAGGRFFVELDESPSSPPVVVITSRLLARLGTTDRIVNAQIALDSQAYTVVGVAPERFRFHPGVDVWICRQSGQPRRLGNTASIIGAQYLQAGLIARVAPGASDELAQEQLSGLQRQQEEDARRSSPQMAIGRSVVIVTPIIDAITGNRQRPIQLLAVSAVLVLVIACATVITMQLSHFISRRHELALRFVLGATRLQVLRQLITENLLLAACGGIGGLIVAVIIINLARTFVSAAVSGIVLSDATVDLNVVGVCAITVLLAAALVGMICGWQVVILPPASRTSGVAEWVPRARRLRRTVVVIEVALAYILLLASALTLRTAVALAGTHPGFEPNRVLTVDIAVPSPLPAARVASAWEEVVRVLRRDPRIEAVGVVNRLPLSRTIAGRQWYEAEDAGSAVGGPEMANWLTATVRIVTGDYFRTMGIPVHAGDPTSNASSEGGLIINRAFAQRYWQTESAIGRRVQLNGAWRRVVSVIGDIKASSLTDKPEAQMHIVRDEFSERQAVVVIRLGGGAALGRRDIYEYVRRVEPQFSIVEIKPMADVVRESLGPQRFRAFLVGGFTLMALVIAMAGVAAIAAYTMNQRRREFGIRIALGAGTVQMLTTAFRDTLIVTGLGLSLGLCVSPFLLREARRFLPEAATEYSVLALALSAALVITTLAASYWPIRSGLRVDPVEVMRDR